MFSNTSKSAPLVMNSHYNGHGFTDEDNNNEDVTQSFFNYGTLNDELYASSNESQKEENTRTLPNGYDQLYYTNTPKSAVYRESSGGSVPYESIGVSYYTNATYSPSSTYEKLCNWFNASTDMFINLSYKAYDVLIVTLFYCKLILFYTLRLAFGVLMTLLILSLVGRLFVDRNGNFDEISVSKKTSGPSKTEDSKPSEKVPPPKSTLTVDPVYFKDILGIDDAKEDLFEVVKFIKHPELYKNVGAKIPKGILLVGSPGTGKTMLAKAVATEAGIPFIYTSGPEFVEIFVGQGAQRVRSLFAKARKTAPCIIFIDEIDAVGSKRASGSFSGQNREHDQTLNQLLVELDGFNVSTGITVLAATNRIETLDRALLRPGRFDRIIHIPLPTLDGREAILKRYLSDVKYDKDEINVREFAKLTPGFSGADLKNLVNEAALNCVKDGRNKVAMVDMQEARDKVSIGSKRRLIQPELQRKMTAYHEAGHALVAYHLYPDADPIHKATIISRGTALGFVEQLPEGDRSSYKLAQMKARLAVCMGGRIAEELVFGKENVTSGASSDIYAATELAYRMVTEWGMSKKLGPINYTRIGAIMNLNGNRTLSTDTATIVEQEVKILVDEAHKLAEGIIRQHRDQLELIATQLMEHETLTGQEIRALLDKDKSQT